MATRKGQRRGKRAGGGGSLPLLAEIEGCVEGAARKMIRDGNLSLADLVKLRDIVREILAERPHEVVVRWVDPAKVGVREVDDGGKQGSDAGTGKVDELAED